MAPAIFNIGVANSNASNALSITIGAGGVPANSLICVIAGSTSEAGNVGNISDTKNGIYIPKFSVALTSGNFNTAIIIYSITWNSIALVSGNKITFAYPGPQASADMSALYITGAQTSADPTRDIQTVRAQATTLSPNASCSAVSGDFVCACMAIGLYNSSDAFTQDPNFQTPFSHIFATATGILGGSMIANSTNISAGTAIYNPTVGTARDTLTLITSYKQPSSPIKNYGFSMPFPT